MKKKRYKNIKKIQTEDKGQGLGVTMIVKS